MSMVEGIGGSGSTSIAALFLKLLQQRETQRSSEAKATGAAGTGSGNGQGVDALKSKIDAAISNALQNLDKSSDASTVMDTIQQAIDDTLKANGIEPESMNGRMPPPPPDGDMTGGGRVPGMQGAGVPKAGSGDGFQTRLDELLQENGYDPERIRSELAASRSSQTDQGQFSLIDFLRSLQSQQGVDLQA